MMSEECVELAKICVGLNERRPIEKNGHPFFAANENEIKVSTTERHALLFNEMEKKGYVKRGENKGGWIGYSLTRRGVEWLSEKTGIEIVA